MCWSLEDTRRHCGLHDFTAGWGAASVFSFNCGFSRASAGLRGMNLMVSRLSRRRDADARQLFFDMSTANEFHEPEPESMWSVDYLHGWRSEAISNQAPNRARRSS
jgi:hypothetical protein